ncbi:acyltransferase family protein [Candidatus Ruminimicrobium bovinum]|uniref:acyltransferase family protein n=1 Tax=Candidatus Ruminimicrobium bovinum TaxID=3242779 RepID=UPI0039B8A1FE
MDYARSIALFLVVFAHLYSVDSDVKLYIYAFHMPFFFLISGMLHRDMDYVALLKKMIKRMLIPFTFFLFIGYLYCALSSKSLALGAICGSVAGIVMGKDITANDILWFFIALFWVRLMGNWFLRQTKTAIPVLVMLSCMAYGFHINNLYIGTSLMALPFYLIGYYARIVIPKIAKPKWSVLLTIIFLSMSVFISNYNGKVSMMGCSFGTSSVIPLRYLLFYVNGIIGSIAIIALVGGIKMNLLWLLKPSKCAVSIVVLQFIPIMIWYRSVGFNQNYFISCAYSVLIISGCILFHCYVERHANWLLGGK